MIAIMAYGIQGALGIWRFAEEKEVRLHVQGQPPILIVIGMSLGNTFSTKRLRK